MQTAITDQIQELHCSIITLHLEAAADHIDIRNGWEREEWRNPYVPVQSLNTVVKLVQIQSVILFDVHTNAVYMVDPSYS